jgi:hypothetical protein
MALHHPFADIPDATSTAEMRQNRTFPVPLADATRASAQMTANRSYQELSNGEVRLWIHEGGAIALKCVTREGDPVELSENEAEELATALMKFVAELRGGA